MNRFEDFREAVEKSKTPQEIEREAKGVRIVVGDILQTIARALGDVRAGA